MKRLVLDTETGGLRAREHSLLTIGLVLAEFTPDGVDFIDEKHFHLKHDEYRVSKSAMRVNKIDLDNHHKIASYPEVILQEIDSFMKEHLLYETPLLGHNVHFDINFVNSLCEDFSCDFPFSRSKSDTRYIWDRLKKGGYVNPYINSKLSTIADFFRIDTTNAHDALADCKITAKCFSEMLKMQEKNR